MDVVPPVGGASGVEVEADGEARSGYYTAAWVAVFLFAPFAIVFNLMDNSVCKFRGQPPKFGPTVAALLLWAVGYLLLALMLR
jgi:hypothetical protein